MERKGAMHLQYGEVRQAYFLERPNRFIAHVELEGETVVCHVTVSYTHLTLPTILLV